MKTLILLSLSLLTLSFACSRLRHIQHTGWDYIEKDDIFTSSEKGDIENIKWLYGINKDTINKVDERGFTSLTLASHNNKENVVDYLIDKNVEIDNPTQTQSALQGACQKGFLSIVKKLLKAGANPDFTDTTGMTALHYAVQSGHTDIIRELVKNNADPNIKDNNGVTPIDIAKQKNDSGILALLGIK